MEQLKEISKKYVTTLISIKDISDVFDEKRIPRYKASCLITGYTAISSSADSAEDILVQKIEGAADKFSSVRLCLENETKNTVMSARRVAIPNV